MTFAAQYDGTCPGCGGRIRVGQQIETRRDGGTAQHYHARCPDDPIGLRDGETVCTDCWLVHPAGACDA